MPFSQFKILYVSGRKTQLWLNFCDRLAFTDNRMSTKLSCIITLLTKCETLRRKHRMKHHNTTNQSQNKKVTTYTLKSYCTYGNSGSTQI
ncbi:hypothetical protein T4B_13436 [Trichinella pseudospiralis]|uniref:Uncharacterized protein n=1 Tax=Trichinella pseudospiralis TaxID=6337 RepID=A0A0V1HHH6_TRIPS|nr:hypothetical protein T4B_13436 [Trichinella pseudospiralis]